MHTKQSVLKGLVASIIAFRGHPEEKKALLTTLTGVMGNRAADMAQQRNLIEQITGKSILDVAGPTNAPPADFPQLTGDGIEDGKTVAAWMLGGTNDTSDIEDAQFEED